MANVAARGTCTAWKRNSCERVSQTTRRAELRQQILLIAFDRYILLRRWIDLSPNWNHILKWSDETIFWYLSGKTSELIIDFWRRSGISNVFELRSMVAALTVRDAKTVYLCQIRLCDPVWSCIYIQSTVGTVRKFTSAQVSHISVGKLIWWAFNV